MVAKLHNPSSFSQTFGVDPEALEDAGLLNPILNCDTSLFIDPLLIRTSSCSAVSDEGYELLKQRFERVIRLVNASRRIHDPAWLGAMKQLDLSERPETCLGFGGASISGSSRPEAIKVQILTTAKEILELGENDPEIISLMGMFEDGVGPDTISDLTTTAIAPALAELTSEFAVRNEIPVQIFRAYPNLPLPLNPYRAQTPVLLVPKDILRDLPLATDWSDVSTVIFENQAIRDAFNAFVGDIAQATLSDKKHAIKRTALRSLENFRAIFEAVIGGSTNYDPNEDVLGFYALVNLLSLDRTPFAGTIEPPAQKNGVELLRIVGEIVDNFSQMVEHNNLWELLWAGNRPRKERAAQLVFFGIADAYCKSNDVDISPETNQGGGPVDFKFSSGYRNRVLVELKLSTGAVVHGYKTQLEVYKNAARTDAAYFVIIDVGKMGKKLETILELHNAAVRHGDPVSKIVVIDASRKASASRR